MTFLKRLFGARADEAQVEEHQTSFEPCSPQPVSIIGDIHGCYDLMVRLFDKIDATDTIIGPPPKGLSNCPVGQDKR